MRLITCPDVVDCYTMRVKRATLLVATVLLSSCVYGESIILTEIDPISYGAKGDGISDDTQSLQKAFNICSKKGLTCRIPNGKIFLVTAPLFLWGNASLLGEDGTGTINFNVQDSPYLLNIGISGRNRLEKPFSGVISGIKFKVTGGSGGRVIFFWRTSGAQILDNIFDAGEFAYSATSSGNDNSWVRDGFKNYIRTNISIKRNRVTARGLWHGSEGFGLGHFDGAVIEDNEVIGVGDDPVGIHFSKNIKIINNTLKSVDGRLLVVNSRNVEIAHNKVERMPSLQDGRFYKGISLLYVGFETLGTNSLSAPTNTYVHDNYLYYPEGAIDPGAAIYLYGPRDATIDNNLIVNDSALVTATAFHLLPAKFDGQWSDPDLIDPAHVARVWDVTVSRNASEGKHPLRMIMTGNCVEYKGAVIVKNNYAQGYNFYCDGITLIDNREGTR